MHIAPGTRILHYDLEASIGRGGMGEVFRARDAKLGRDVAIKLLPEEFSRDAERLARFEREARILASLNHPHIASIYGFEEVEGTRFLVMELAAGRNLAEVLEGGPLPVEEALAYARQIAGALEAAHEKGVIHRDLKPANVMVDAEGNLRVLDFGLAKAFESEDTDSTLSNSPTLAHGATVAGVILGTAAYMSPEQARGKRVDKRADIWAFGVVLWEMLSGKQLFAGETVSDTLASVLKEEPDWTELPAGVPAHVRRLLRRCLAKKPSERLRDAGDVLVELDDTREEAPLAASLVPAAGGFRRWLPWAVAVLAVAALASILLLRPARETEAPLRKLTVYSRGEGRENRAVLSPDGRYVAYKDEEGLMVRDLESPAPRRLVTRKNGVGILFWSFDGRRLAYSSEDKLWKIEADGSAPTVICTIPPERGSICGAWGKGDRIVLGQWRGGILEVSANGGSLKEIVPATDDLVDYHALRFLPDGVTLLGLSHRGDGTRRIEWINGTESKTVLEVEHDSFVGFGGYSPTGHLVVEREVESGVWAVPFSVGKLETTGEPFVVAPGAGQPSPAGDGSMIYLTNVHQRPSRLVRVSPDGTVLGAAGPAGEGLVAPLFSPDGRTLAYSQDENGNENVWLLDLASGATRRLTLGDSRTWDEPTSWSPDGRQLLILRQLKAWDSPENGLWLVDIAASSVRQVNQRGISGSFLPGGQTLVVEQFSTRNEDDLALLTLDGGELAPLIRSPHWTGNPAVSPDGRLLAYSSNESGAREVWLTALPDAEGKRQISVKGGYGPVWSRDGRTLYFTGEDAVYAVAIGGGDPPTVGAPRALFDRSKARLFDFDVLPDGSGFMMVQGLPPGNQDLVYVQNWFSEFANRPGE